MHILLIIILALVFLPGLWVRKTLWQHSKPLERIPGTGSELVNHLKQRFALDIQLEETDSGDHYDPESKTIRLSRENLEGRSLTAVATAAHEFGHALQHAKQERMLELRTQMAKKSARVSAFGTGLLFLAPVLAALTRSPAMGLLALAGVLLAMIYNTFIHLVTLPVEWDASFGKALPILQQGNYLNDEDMETVRKILKACALTYVAQSILSVINIRNLFAILRR